MFSKKERLRPSFFFFLIFSRSSLLLKTKIMTKYLTNLLVFNKFLTLLGILLVWKYEVGNPARLLAYRGEPMVYAHLQKESISKSEIILKRIRPVIIVALIAIIILLIYSAIRFYSHIGMISLVVILPIWPFSRTLYQCCFGSAE